MGLSCVISTISGRIFTNISISANYRTYGRAVRGYKQGTPGGRRSGTGGDMFILVGESTGKTHSLSQVARDLSLSISVFGGKISLGSLMGGQARRIVFLAEDDLSDSIISELTQADEGVQFGLIICADREALRTSSRATLFDHLAGFPNVEWVDDLLDVDRLCQAARACRRRMLRISRHELEDAIINREFLIQYQPKVDRGDGAQWLTREAEALIRWRHPEHGLLGPLEFLPELEAFNLIGPVSELVLNEAARQLKKWREQGLNLNSCINLATSLLNDPSLPDGYARIVEKHNLYCASFTFEVIEQDVANSDAPHLNVLKALREKGFRISLDDFGVAASSLGAFEQLPFDEIKIHASALARAKASPVAQQVLAAVTGLAHNLGISVCAEGVEDEETYEFLKTIECDKMQGFLISEAVMPDIIRRVYSAQKKEIEDVA
jgi:EAL domain-containing protein (putative c-di-GMP-specific phosphodiesterase class I)